MQRIVPPQHRFHRFHKRRRFKLPRQPHRQRFVVGAGSRFAHLRSQPNFLLRFGQGKGGFVRGGQKTGRLQFQNAFLQRFGNKGKVVVAAYAYTRCPHGCAGVAAQMKKLNDAFADQTDRLHFVSIAVWPAIDTPEVFKAYATSLEIPDSAPWWWLSTDRDKTWAFMTDQLGFGPSREVPEAERLNPEDWVEHDLRAVLLDSNLRVRGYYEVMHPQTEVAQMAYEKLQRDITTLLNESE